MPTSHPADVGFAGAFLVEKEDRAAFASASGILTALPKAVAVPRNAEDVSTLLRWASQSGNSVIPRGAATGMPGGNVGPHVVVDMVSNFREPPLLHPEFSTAEVEPGITLAELNNAAARFDLHFPVDPSSGARCTLGGMIANNAAGAHSVRYGATRAWVDALDVVLADGSFFRLRRGVPPETELLQRLSALDARLAHHRNQIAEQWPRVRKNSSGYALLEYLTTRDPIDLLVGSEGTLALITRACLRLGPRLPAVGLVVLEFADLESAAEAVERLLPLQPSTCELMDRTFLDLVRRAGTELVYPLHPRIEALLLVEIAAADNHERETRIHQAQDAAGSLASRVTTAVEPNAIDELWELRHAASPIIAREAGSRVSMQFIEDSVVPIQHLPQYIVGLRSILESHKLPAVIFGHAGDGNLHVNPLIDVTAPEWRYTVDSVLREAAQLVIGLGGTLAGEHGDGRLRAPLLSQVWGDQLFSCFQAVKAAFDPEGILNPGVILPLPDQTPFDLLRTYG